MSGYDLQWWRSQCGVVMQDGVIFSESIARNIAVDDGDIDEARLKDAARIAHIDGYIDSMPLGYNTMIGRNGTGTERGTAAAHTHSACGVQEIRSSSSSTKPPTHSTPTTSVP
jgi:ABC-type transport system involved in cytochrome bd biosynthesis fused ATPase/permease subunit